MNNDFKQKLQEREFLALKDEQRVILKWATGCGKSKMTIDLMNRAISFYPITLNRHIRVLLVVAERAHIKNWDQEFDKWHPAVGSKASRTRYTKMICYNSLHKVKDESWDIVIFDEGHHLFTEKRMAALEELKENLFPNAHIYLLSATLSSGKVDMIEEIFGKFTISTVTLKDAIEKDILPDPKVYVIGMELDDKNANQELRENGADDNSPVVSWEKRFKYLSKKLPCIIKCTERQKYLDMTNTMEYWKNRYERSHNEFQRSKWVNMGSQRKRYLGELKTEYVRTLINRFPKYRRFVCFCASVAQANSLSKHYTISAKRASKVNQGIIDAFNEKKINSIYAVGMITEGMNLTDIQTGIIAQLDGKERLFIQKFGRICRSDSPTQYIFYYKDTQDEVYLKKALENIDPKFVKYCSLDELWKII